MSITLRLGNNAVKEAFREPVLLGLSRGDLEERASASGIPTALVPGDLDSAPADDETLRARVEAALQYRHVEGEGVTTVSFPEGKSLTEAFLEVTAPGSGIWANHSFDAAPAWVATSWDALGALLADRYGCPIGEPEGWMGAAPAAAPEAEVPA